MSPDLVRVLEELRALTNKFNLTGSGVAGNLVDGYTIQSETRGGSAGSGGGPVSPTGACCIGEECSVVTEVFCNASGGTYQGDGTSCFPNPCTATCICAANSPVPQHVAGTITLNCDPVFCGVSSHVELVDNDLTGFGCQCSVSFGYTFECDEACTPCFLDGSISVEYDVDLAQWLLIITYGYSNSASVVLCSFSAQWPFDFSGGGPVTIDEDVPSFPSGTSHITITIT